MKCARVLGIAFACAGFASVASAQGNQARAITGKQASKYAPWSFEEDFSKGIPAWMSFPLAQDIGYDPSIYTTAEDRVPALVRDVVAAGQRDLLFGVARPLRFHMTPSSVIDISYELSVCGTVRRIDLLLGDQNGKRYAASLPARSGPQHLRIDGRTLGIGPAGADAELTVLEADVSKPILGSHNRLTVRNFTVHAQRVPELPLAYPTLDVSRGMDLAVAEEYVRANSKLRVQLQPGPGNTEVTVWDGSGVVANRLNAGSKTSLEISLAGAVTPGLWRARIERDGKVADFRFLVLSEVPSHPRVLLDAERLRQLSAPPYAQPLAQSIHQKATELAHQIAYNSHTGDNIAALPHDSVFPGLPEYFALMENYSSAIAYNALDFRLTGNADALESARRALLTISAWPAWTPSWFAAHGLHTYYEVGVFTQRVALGYDLIADRLTGHEKQVVAAALLHNSIEPSLQEYFWNDRMPLAASNHMAQSIGGAIEACVATYGDIPNWDAHFAPALAELIADYENLLQGVFAGDGSGAEPAGYQMFAQEGMSFGMAALHALHIRPRGSERMLEGFNWLRYIAVRPELILGTGDSGRSLSVLSGYAWSAEHSGDAAARSFYEMAPRWTLSALLRPAEHSSSAPAEAPGLLDLVCCTSPASPAAAAPPSKIFPSRGSVALRSSWSPDDTVVSIRVGPWFNHEHHDQGSFQVAAFGEELISEAGYADYYKESHYADYFTQSAGHNTVLIDGDAFSQNSYDGRFWPAFQNYPRVIRYVLGQGLDYLYADLAPAYNGSLKKYSREFVFLKPSLLIVHDQIQAPQTHRFSFLVHLPAGDQVQAAGAEATVTGKAASARILAAGENAEWILERTPATDGVYTGFEKSPFRLPSRVRLDSPQTAHQEFLVGMNFANTDSGDQDFHSVAAAAGRGFEQKTAESTLAAIFRSHPGELSYDSASTDGEVLALQGTHDSRQVFAAGARSLSDGNRVTYSSDALTDLVITSGSSQDVLEVFASMPTSVTVQVQRSVRAVKVDGQPSQARISGKVVTLRIPEGEHRVSILH